MDDKLKLAMSEIWMPTPEEHRAVSLKWLSRIQPTLIDQWPAEVAALSMETKFVRVPDGLSDEFWSLHDGKRPGPVMDAVAAEIDAAMGWDRWFVRLNSRSPKDNIWPYEANAFCSGKDALSVLACSERVLDDLLEFNYVPEQPAYICLRERVYWIQPKWEFRCFVKDGELIAVTHYDYTKSTPQQIRDMAEDIRGKIDAYFAKVLKPVLHIDTVVFDLALNPYRLDDEPMLVELNPYGLSDPCWFSTYEAVESASSYVETGIAAGFEDMQKLIARAWASIDGKAGHFDAEAESAPRWADDDFTGHYEGYMAEARELMRRAGIDG